MHTTLRHAHSSPRPRGFTLVELLVVVAIIATLVGLLLPAVQSARESSRRVSCANNLSQLSKACLSHLTLIGHYPTGGWNEASIPIAGGGADWRQPGGWCFTILPYLELQSVYDTADTSIPVPLFACPSRRGSSVAPTGFTMTDYAGNRGSWANPAPAANATENRTTTFGANVGGVTSAPADRSADDWATVAQTLNQRQFVLLGAGSVPTGGIMWAGSSLLPARLRDSSGATYLAAEKYVPRLAYGSTGQAGYSRAAYVGDSSDTLRGGHRPPESDTTPWATQLEGAFGGPHAAGFNTAMCDGSVRTIAFEIAASVHFLLAAREDRQPVQPPE